MTGQISFTVGDTDSPLTAISVTGSSSDKAKVPDANITITNTGATRTVTIKPALNQNGLTTITLTVSDGTASAQTTFQLTINPVDDPPVITAQDPLTTPEDTPITLVPGDFTIEDPDGANTFSILVMQGENYQVTGGSIVRPANDFDGELIVIVKAFDGKLSSEEFEATIHVSNVNLAPVITGQNPDPIVMFVNGSFELGDQNLAIRDEVISGFSLKVSPGQNYTLSGALQTTIKPAPDYAGELFAEVIVVDPEGAESAPFTLKIRVVLPNSTPVITSQNELVTNEDESFPLRLEDLIVTDLDNPGYPTGFTLNIQPGENYSVSNNIITPSRNFNNEFLSVPVTVSDGQNTSDPPFKVRVFVRPINDAPEITVIESQVIAYEPGSGPIPISQKFECIDVDNEFLTFAEIKIDLSYSPSNDELIYEGTNTAIRGVYDASTGILSLIGYASVEEYQTAIRSVKYNYRLTLDQNGEPSEISTEPKAVSITLSDGPAESEPGTRSIDFEISVELSIPNAFTPNGDLANSTWAVEPFTNADQFNETITRVFNKRGVLVFESVGLQREKQWDGTYNGEVLPVDTYYYTIDLKLSFIKKTYKGAVMILR